MSVSTAAVQLDTLLRWHRFQSEQPKRNIKVPVALLDQVLTELTQTQGALRETQDLLDRTQHNWDSLDDAYNKKLAEVAHLKATIERMSTNEDIEKMKAMLGQKDKIIQDYVSQVDRQARQLGMEGRTIDRLRRKIRDIQQIAAES